MEPTTKISIAKIKNNIKWRTGTVRTKKEFQYALILPWKIGKLCAVSTVQKLIRPQWLTRTYRSYRTKKTHTTFQWKGDKTIGVAGIQSRLTSTIGRGRRTSLHWLTTNGLLQRSEIDWILWWTHLQYRFQTSPVWFEIFIWIHWTVKVNVVGTSRFSWRQILYGAAQKSRKGC